ncbi:hypothetical protein BDD12DRAFT_725027 [Trichophaea hybrida]|nr:hypothetical protein BDD12DRAFT_725027 [Trichophaea hybrida]
MATATSSIARTPAPGSASVATAGRPQLKGSISGSPNTNNRRATQSPMDGPQRRNSSHKGWPAQPQQQKYSGSGVPTSSSPTPSQAAAAIKSRTPSTAPGGESDTHDKHMHDRMLFLLTKLMAREVVVTVKSGAQYVGILLGADPRNHDLGVSLKQVQLLKPGPGDSDEKTKEGEYLGGGKEKVLVFEPKDVVEVAAQKVYFENEAPNSGTQQNGLSGGFKTDSDISGNTAHRERELHRWQPDESPDVNTGLEDTSSGPGQGWNQFEANERLFGVKSDFDENIYTTKLDRDHPEYKTRAAAAARIAAEIEGQSTSGLSAHVAEERGLVAPDDSGMDEEDKYSGVQRTAPIQVSTNRYTPPARRAPTGQPTVPGAPHDPAIIASQLVRPETLQHKQQQPQATLQSQQSIPKTSEEATTKAKERPGLPEIITPMRSLPAGTPNLGKQGDAPAIERDLSLTFKNFVTHEKERVKKKKADMAHRDRETKLRELKKFSESFTLKTAVPQDLVPILTKDKAKQAEILEKTKQQSLTKLGGSSQLTPSAPSSVQPTTSGSQTVVSQSGKVPPPNSFAARDPERFKRETSALLQNFPQNFPKFPPPQQTLSQSVRQVQLNKNLPVRPPIPVPEQQRPPFAPTGPSASNTTSSGGHKRLNVNAPPFQYRPNPNAAAFTPTFGGQSTNATPSPTASVPPNIASRATSPSLFFGNKRLKFEKERPSIKDNFNPFERMKKTKARSTQTGPVPVKLFGNANDYIDKPWFTTPTWPNEETNKDKSYTTMFATKTDFDPNSVHTTQPTHMMPPQPHQQIATHMPHMSHPPHVPHQPHHGPMQHLIPPHYEQDAHLRQMSTPSSVMPSPSLHNATVTPYQQSPVPHPSQMAMYPNQQGAMQYPGPPGGPQYGFYNNGFGGANGNPIMMHGPQPVPYPAAGQVGSQFVHRQMYSPQQPQAYLNNGPPPPNPQGYPSPGRPAPMMMHQGSSQGTPGGAQMIPYGMQPGQGIYGTQGQQQQMGMMRGQPPPPPHQGGPPPQFYHGPQSHYSPGNRGNYAGPQPGMHTMPPPPQQQMAPPPPPQQPQQQQQQPAAEVGEDGK